MTLRSRLRGVVASGVCRLRSAGAVARPPYAGIIDEAERCLDSPDRAATFRDIGGLDRLETAVDAAESDGHLALATRGRLTLDALSPSHLDDESTVTDSSDSDSATPDVTATRSTRLDRSVGRGTDIPADE